MRFALGFLPGVAVAWATLAIWQRVPPLGAVDAVDEDVWGRVNGVDRPGFGGALASIMPIGARRIPPEIHMDDCRHPARPCVCGVFRDVHGGFGSP